MAKDLFKKLNNENKNIFVACELRFKSKKKLLNKHKHNKLKILKFGLQFLLLKRWKKIFRKFKKDFWLDLKFNDIPQTALSAIEA